MSRIQIDVDVCQCEQKRRLAALVAGFAEAMLEKLEAKLEDDWTGWDNVDGDFGERVIIQRLAEHLPIVPERHKLDREEDVDDQDGRVVVTSLVWDPIDIANFAAFAWHQRSKL